MLEKRTYFGWVSVCGGLVWGQTVCLVVPRFCNAWLPSMARVAVVRSLYFFRFPGQVVVGLDIGCWRNASVKRCQGF